MDTNIRYTALSSAKKPIQISFGKIHLPFEIKTFEPNIKYHISEHLKYNKEKHLKPDVDVKKVKILFEKQKPNCYICGCAMKITNLMTDKFYDRK